MGKLEALAVFAIMMFHRMLGFERREEVLPVTNDRRSGKGKLTPKVAQEIHQRAVQEALQLRDELK